MRSGHAIDEDKIYEKSTDCYVKIPEDPSHKHIAEYFDMLDSSCDVENSDEEEVELEGWLRMTDLFDEINNN